MNCKDRTLSGIFPASFRYRPDVFREQSLLESWLVIPIQRKLPDQRHGALSIGTSFIKLG